MDQKSIIINAITNMNIQTLNVHLKNNSYNKVPKTLFIERLEEQFNILKNSGDHKFEYTSKGFCTKCIKGCSGLSFVTKYNGYLDLIFKESNDEIIDIITCHALQNETPTIKESPVILKFYRDEETDYSHTIETEIILGKIDILLEEYNLLKGEVLDLSIIEDYVFKAKLVDDQISFDMRMNYKCFKPFFSVYLDLQNLLKIYKNHQPCIKALEELKEVDFRSWDSKWKWIHKYQKLYTSLPKKYEDLENDYIVIRDNITLDMKEYKDVIKFNRLFKESIHREY